MSIGRYLLTPPDLWHWPRAELQPYTDYCDADMAWFRRPIANR